MGKKLAIRGHSSRGKEVIEILEMLGGKNIHKHDGGSNSYSYYIFGPAILHDRLSIAEDDDFEIFTLDEFLEKFPYKVGDKVHIYVQNSDIDGRCDIEVAEISSIRWNPTIRKIAYKMKTINREFYKEEIKCKAEDKSSKMKSVLAELLEHIKTTPKEELEREFEELEEWSNVGPTVEEFRTFCECVNRKPKYPTTFEECLDVLYCKSILKPIIGHKAELLLNLEKLLICLDAYYKIAGEEMGLGKPWEPNWTTFEGMPAIFRFRYNIVCDSVKNQHCLLVFPTEEMRNAFCKNFKDLIKSCKELL